MNGSYYKTPVFINEVNRDTNTMPIIEQSYIENILRNNIGKKAKIHASFSDSVSWRDKVFEGIIKHAGRDNIILHDTENNIHYLILMIYLDYVEFDSDITYIK